MTGSYLDEIMEQPLALHRSVEAYPVGDPNWARIAQRIQAGDYRQVILTGMGSSFYSCYPIWLSLNQHKIPATMWETSELIHYAPEAINAQTLLVAVSQSGEGAEIKRLTLLKERPGVRISVTNGTDNVLARWADMPLSTQAGDEAAASNKTYITALAVLHLMSCQLTGQDVGTAQDTLYRLGHALGKFLAEWASKDEEKFVSLLPCAALTFIARGPSMASATTGAVITEETSKVLCKAISAAQFRHGPIEAVREGFRAVVFAGNSLTRALNVRLANQIGSFGGRVLLVTCAPDASEASAGVVQLSIPRADSAVLPISEIIPVQLLTIALAHANGYEPGTFEHSDKVTTEE